MLRTCRAAAASLCLALLAACGGGGQPGQVLPDGGVACTRNRDCASGQGCVQGACQALPCGGCQADEACADNGTCVPAQGATCPQAGCPTGYSCTGSTCAKPCTLDGDCPSGSVCNPGLGKCAQCTFDNKCASVPGKPRCDSASGTCVACTEPKDCGHGTFCDLTNHSCQTGCKVDGDCNVASGERCDGATSSAPGRCIQCAKDSDCTAVNAPACDTTGHCVGCTANKYCPLGTPECDVSTRSCVVCLPSHNADGADCGILIQGNPAKDSHDAQTCNGATHACVNGCQFDTQCGCPIDPQTGKEGNCGRYPHTTCRTNADCAKSGTSGNTCVGYNATNGTPGTCKNAGVTVVLNGEHCDTALTTDGSGAASLGACVECLPGHNEQCKYRVIGASPTDPGTYGGTFAGLNGSRCVNDVCVEGCDSNADCPGSKICHLSSDINDPNRNKCVDCSCAGLTPTDGAWCNDGNNCPSDANGPKVCDAQTLTCRRKRFNETCSHTNECGDTHDPALQQNGSTDCVPVPAACVKVYQPTSTDPVTTQCRTPGAPYGRCGIPCNDFQTNQCISGDPQGNCPSNTTCRGANDNEGKSGKYCIPSSCR